MAKLVSSPSDGVCRFCLASRSLVASHILPKFLYQPLKNDKGHLIGVHGEGRHGTQPLQDGPKQLLFCTECEQLFSTRYERPFANIWSDPQNNPLPGLWPEKGSVECRVDYAPFKLFHLLNLFRASVSASKFYEEVELGPHTDLIRRMLVDMDPGPPDKYPIKALGMFRNVDREVQWTVTKPERLRDGGKTCYGQAYGGV